MNSIQVKIVIGGIERVVLIYNKKDMFNLSSSGEWKKEKFIKDAIESNKVFYVANKDGYGAYLKSNLEEIPGEKNPIVHLIWSNKGLANQAIKTVFIGWELGEMDLEVFLESFLKDIYEDGDFIGVNLIAPEFIGPELNPIELAEEIAQYKEK